MIQVFHLLMVHVPQQHLEQHWLVVMVVVEKVQVVEFKVYYQHDNHV
jgi:hypothetical protein